MHDLGVMLGRLAGEYQQVTLFLCLLAIALPAWWRRF